MFFEKAKKLNKKEKKDYSPLKSGKFDGKMVAIRLLKRTTVEMVMSRSPDLSWKDKLRLT